MKIIVCPSCEKKLKVPDSLVAKGAFKCPACGQTLKLPKSASGDQPRPSSGSSVLSNVPATLSVPKPVPKPAAKPKPPVSDAEEVLDLDEADLIEEPRVAKRNNKPNDDELLEEDIPQRRSRVPSRELEPVSLRNAKSKAGSSQLLGILIGAGSVLVIVALVAITWMLTRKGADQPLAQNSENPSAAVSPPAGGNAPTLAVPNTSVPAAPQAEATALVPNAVAVPSPQLPSSTPANPPVIVPNPMPPAQPNPQPPVPIQPAPAQPNPASSEVAANPQAALRYKWQPNREYPYKFSIEANLGDVVEKTDGVCVYKVATVPSGPIIEFKQQGTGTAFVVSADGFLVTCAHVVSGARTIEVHLGGKKYPATVVSSDAARDVAVIRINANNLTPVPLTNSDSVQLGQPARAFGFPLSDVLGNNLKVTTGTVSGLNQESNSRVFQIDAAINPGNSGGPIVNEMGEVIGVASAKLAGPRVSTVGFARPINDVRPLLQQANVQFVPGNAQQKLDGPVLAAKVSPSVALVSVVVGASGNRTTLVYEASFTTSQRPAPGRNLINFSIPSSSRSTGTVTLDEFGEVVEFKGEEQLPFCLGPVGLIAIAPLNPNGQASWGRNEETSVTRIEQDPNDPFARMRGRGVRRPPFGPPIGFPGSPFGERQKKETVFPAQETTSFTLGQQIADVQLVKKSYELKTLDNAASPYLQLKGEGDWRFHVKDAMPYSAELKFELARNFDNVTIRVPFQMQFIHTDPQVIVAERKEAENRMLANIRDQSQKAAAELDKLASAKKAKLVRRFPPIGTILIQAVQLTPDGQRALVSTHEGPVLVFDAKQDESIRKLEGLKQNIQFLNVSPDGKLACGGTLTETCVWNLDSGQIVLQPKSEQFAPSCMAFSPDRQQVYFARLVFQCWDLGSGKMLNDWRPQSFIPKALTVTPDGQSLIATDGKVLLHFNPQNGELQKTEPLAPGSGNYAHGRLTAEGDRGVFVKNHSSLDVISLSNPTKPSNITARPAPNNSFAISANGKRVVVADSSNKQVVVWDVEKNELVDQWPVDTIAAQTVALSADGKFVLTCGYHRILQLWEMTE